MSDHTLATLDQLAGFDAIIDVRSPAEFAEDHIPGAINCPVLDNEECIRVGTLYKQVSPFEARKVGAALVARNIARHIETLFSSHPKSWKPMIYCWRGGQRSGAFTHILREIGWAARRLEGGYKTWRHHVIDGNAVIPLQFDFKVIAGPTGSAKTRVLEALHRLGHQVLNLELLAAHKGSVLGSLPNIVQPSQKMFETLIYTQLSGFDPVKPVFVEAESRKIGQLRLPQSILDAISRAKWFRIDANINDRVQFLLDDYGYLLSFEQLESPLDRLIEMCGRTVVEQWKTLAKESDFSTLVKALLENHYDRYYLRSMTAIAQDDTAVQRVTAIDLSRQGIERLASVIAAAAQA